MDDPPLTKVEQITRRIWFHRIVSSSLPDLDETFLARVRQAAEVSQGLS